MEMAHAYAFLQKHRKPYHAGGVFKIVQDDQPFSVHAVGEMPKVSYEVNTHALQAIFNSPWASPTADPLAGVYNDHQREIEYLRHEAERRLRESQPIEIYNYDTLHQAIAQWTRQHDRHPTEFIVNPEVWYELRNDMGNHHLFPLDDRGMRLCGMDVEVNPEVRSYLFR